MRDKRFTELLKEAREAAKKHAEIENDFRKLRAATDEARVRANTAGTVAHEAADKLHEHLKSMYRAAGAIVHY